LNADIGFKFYGFYNTYLCYSLPVNNYRKVYKEFMPKNVMKNYVSLNVRKPYNNTRYVKDASLVRFVEDAELNFQNPWSCPEIKKEILSNYRRNINGPGRERCPIADLYLDDPSVVAQINEVLSKDYSKAKAITEIFPEIIQGIEAVAGAMSPLQQFVITQMDLFHDSDFVTNPATNHWLVADEQGYIRGRRWASRRKEWKDRRRLNYR
jgi:hypothetical protein